MSAPKKINDHSSWVGKGSAGTVFPAGAKMKQMNGAVGAGHEADYEDTAEEIKSAQDKAVSKVKAHPMKDNYRN